MWLRTFSIVVLILLNSGLCFAQSGAPKVEFEIEGYYRARGQLFINLFDKEFPKDGARDLSVYYLDGPIDAMPQGFVTDWQQRFPNATTREMTQAFCRRNPSQCRRAVTNPDRSGFFTQRGRFEPIVRVGPIKAQATIDLFDNVVWGDNASKASTALFAGDPSVTGTSGQENATFQIKRAWMEFDIPVGKLRIGRQPSDWGLGLLGNDGNGFDDLFGENHGGSTYDRVLFATRPLAIAQKAMGKADSGFPLFFAVAVDRLVERRDVVLEVAVLRLGRVLRPDRVIAHLLGVDRGLVAGLRLLERSLGLRVGGLLQRDGLLQVRRLRAGELAEALVLVLQAADRRLRRSELRLERRLGVLGVAALRLEIFDLLEELRFRSVFFRRHVGVHLLVVGLLVQQLAGHDGEAAGEEQVEDDEYATDGTHDDQMAPNLRVREGNGERTCAQVVDQRGRKDAKQKDKRWPIDAPCAVGRPRLQAPHPIARGA